MYAGRFLRLVALATVASCGAAGFPKARSQGGQAWIRVDTPHMTVISHQDEDGARAAAARLELWWEAMSQAMPVATPDLQPAKLTVVALRNGWEADGVSPQIKGAYLGFPQMPLLYVGDPDNLDGASVTRHELAHAFIGARLHGVPKWLNEGFAKYLETGDYDEGEGVVTWGAMNPNLVREVNTWRRPTPRTIVDEQWPASDYGLLTFRAGILVHMLVNQHADELGCFIAALAGREPAPSAFPRCFPSFAGWDAEMRDYEFSVSFPTHRSQVGAPTVSSLLVSSVPDAEVHTWLGVLDIGIADMVEPQFRAIHVERGQQNLRQALDADPSAPLVVAAAVRWLPSAAERIAELTAGLISAHPGDWRAWRARAGTPGLPEAEAAAACEQVGNLAPEELDDAELSPCSRD